MRHFNRHRLLPRIPPSVIWWLLNRRARYDRRILSVIFLRKTRKRRFTMLRRRPFIPENIAGLPCNLRGAFNIAVSGNIGIAKSIFLSWRAAFPRTVHNLRSASTIIWSRTNQSPYLSSALRTCMSSHALKCYNISDYSSDNYSRSYIALFSHNSLWLGRGCFPSCSVSGKPFTANYSSSSPIKGGRVKFFRAKKKYD